MEISRDWPQNSKILWNNFNSFFFNDTNTFQGLLWSQNVQNLLIFSPLYYIKYFDLLSLLQNYISKSDLYEQNDL